jgi:hypothetical protein
MKMANIVETIASVVDGMSAAPLDENASSEPVGEIIGRTTYGGAQASLIKSRTRVKTVDDTVPDYEFYDKLRRGKTRGYALGSLFAKRIENIYATWIMGDGVFVSLKESGDDDADTEDPRTYTDGELNDFVSEELTTFITVERDKFGIGDQYIVVNVDGSLSVPSPDTVEVERNPFDYRDVEAVEITTKMDDVTIVDRYEKAGRTVTVTDAMQRTTVAQFENLFDGEIPVVQVSFGMSANETNGHSVHEQMVPLYDQYDEVIFKQLDGVKLIGSPMLAIQGLDDLTGVVNLNEPSDTTTYSDKDANEVERQQLNIDENAVLLIGKGGQALFVAPPTGFTADTQQALKTLFLLILDHTGIPEFIWGNEISSGRSSSEVQLEQWTRDVTGMRRFDEKWLKRLCVLWLKAQALIDPKIVVDELTIAWPELRGDDAELLLKQLQFTANESMLTREDMLTLLDLVDDAADAVARAEEEADARAEKAFPDGNDVDFGQRLSSDGGGGFDDDDE